MDVLAKSSFFVTLVLSKAAPFWREILEGSSVPESVFRDSTEGKPSQWKQKRPHSSSRSLVQRRTVHTDIRKC